MRAIRQAERVDNVFTCIRIPIIPMKFPEDSVFLVEDNDIKSSYKSATMSTREIFSNESKEPVVRQIKFTLSFRQRTILNMEILARQLFDEVLDK
jgi:hypothetical protein